MKSAWLPFVCISLLLACQSPQTPNNQPVQPSAQSSNTTTKTIAVGASPHGIASADGFVYNVNSSMGTIAVIDASNDQVVKLLTLPEGKASDITAVPDGKHLVVINQIAGKLHIYAPAQDHKLVQSIDVGKSPGKLLFSSDGRKAWVANSGDAQLVELDFSKGLDQAPVLSKKATGAIADSGTASRGLAVNNAWAAITNSGDNTVSLFSQAGGEASSITAGNEPLVLGFAGQGAAETLIIGNSASNTVTLYPLATRQATTLSEVGLSPSNMLVVEELERAFMTMTGSNEVAVIDYRQGKVLNRIPVGRRPVHIYAVDASFKTQQTNQSANQELWVSTDGESSVVVIDPVEMKIKATHKVGRGHHKMAFWNQKAFISNMNDNTISVIERTQTP